MKSFTKKPPKMRWIGQKNGTGTKGSRIIAQNKVMNEQKYFSGMAMRQLAMAFSYNSHAINVLPSG